MTQEKEKFEAFVHNFCKSLPSHGLGQAISYALQGGKRFRALLTLSVSKDLDLDEKNAYKIALAIEIFHQMSLVIDDLPALDNDDLRHGKPATHKKFGEATAILSSFCMLILGSGFLLESSNSLQNSIALCKYFFSKIGLNGTFYGEFLDVLPFDKMPTACELDYINLKKTGDVFACCFALPALSLGLKTDVIEFLEKAGHKLGLAFQLQDDLLNLTKDAKILNIFLKPLIKQVLILLLQKKF